MFVNIRNGIVLYQYVGNNPNQPSFLTKTSGPSYYVTLNTSNKDFAITCSHGTAEYLKTFYNNVSNAWGPFNDTDTHYLYIDIDTLNANVSYGSTLLAPGYGNNLPLSPVTDQNFFDTYNMKALVWTGSSWVPKIRVFVGEVDTSTVTHYIGTVTATNTPYTTGPIIYSGIGKGVLKQDKTFLTLSEKFYIDNIAFGSTSLEQSAIPVRAGDNLAGNRFVKIDTNGTLMYANPSDVGVNLIFVLAEPLNIGEVTYLSVGGVVQNSSWNWSTIGVDLFVGENGTISTNDPALINPMLPSKPAVGKTLSSTSAIINPLMFLGNVSGGSTYTPPLLDWQPSTIYTNTTILVRNVGRLYELVTPHTSGLTFSDVNWKIVSSYIENWQSDVSYYNYADYRSLVVYDDQLYICNNTHTSGLTFSSGDWILVAGGSGGLSWQLIDTNVNAVAGNGYVVDIVEGDVVVTLPLTPNVNDEIIVSVDTDINSTANVCTISPNGNLLKGQLDDVDIDINSTSVRMIWIGGTIGWAIV